MTIHKWAGLSDGRFSNQHLLDLIINDDRYDKSRKRIENTDVLIIDEISMLSLKMFEQLEYILRNIRQCNFPFGGIQIVLVGDFVQLPPVRNTRYRDAGDFCFQSLHFPVHVIFLKTVFRQDDQTFCDIIRKVSLGDIDEACENFIYDLSRPLPSANETTITRLFSQNIMTDMYNRDVILSMPGQLYSFESIDEGEEKYLNTMLAPKTLWLKENAKCILLRNLSDSLVNGLQGKVLQIREGSVDVYFPSLNEMTTLSRVNFTVFDPDSCRNLASRYQIPLKLSYAITVHKAQGMTLERVEVDCRNIFQPGQLGVAMGRVKSAEGLRVINFTADVVIKQPLIVREFLLKDCKPAIQDLSCCHECVKQPEIENPASAFPEFSIPSIKAPEDCDHDININDELDDEEIDEVIRQLDLSNVIIEFPNTIPLPDDYNFIEEVKSLKFEEPQRENQKIHNSCIDYLLENKISLKKFLTSLYSWIGNMYEKAFIGDTSVQKVREQTTFFVEFQKFVSSTTYKNECLILFSGLNVCDHNVIFPLCYQILSALRELYIQKRAENLPTDEFCERFRKLRSLDVNSNLTDSALGKIRYVAGFVVAKLRYHNMLKVQRSAFKTSKEHLLNYEHGKRCMTVLDSFKASEFSLLESQCPGSLKETKRKQNISRGLTNVTDDFYILFSEIVSEILSLLASRNVSSKGTDIYFIVKQSLSSNICIYQKYLSLTTKCKTAELIPYEIEGDFDSMQAAKAVIGVDQCLEEIVTMVEVLEEVYDSILNKTISVFIKQFSKDLMDSLNIKKKMEHRKQIHTSEKKSQSKSHSETSTSSPASATSKDVKKSKSKTSRKQKAPVVSNEPVASTSADNNEVDDTLCAKCDKMYNENEDWICCDSCSNWYHRKCARLSNFKKWNKYQKSNTDFCCYQCE